MTKESNHEFLRNLDKTLWATADKLRANLDAAQYKHAVLGLIFLKYVSDAFDARRIELRRLFADPKSDYHLPQDGEPDAIYAEAVEYELEDRDYYAEANVFWVPPLARWKTLLDSAKLPPGTEIPVEHGNSDSYKIRSVALLIDDALDAIEKDNEKRLKNVLNKTYYQFQLDPDNLRGLIDLIASIPFQHDELKAQDILGHVYEYFLGQFAQAEGKKGGQYFTPKSIVSLIVDMLEPHHGRVYDPAMGSGGFFVQSEKFIEAHGGRLGDISVYGQESNPTTWRLAAMNMAIRGIDFNFGRTSANSFTNDQHPDLRADFVMANPPFNDSDWWNAKLAEDPRWKYGTPPTGNANFAWLQHMLYHLAPTGTMALLLANGSMSGTSGGEGEIRKSLVEADLVECMVALPGQLFTNTQIPACVWVLTKDKSARDGRRSRTGEVLFLDARNVGTMVSRVLRAFSDEDRDRIAGTFHAWRTGTDYADEPGFCKSATLAEIAEHGLVLTPGRYVGTAAAEDDGEPFEEKMQRLTAELAEQFAESAKLEATIRANLEGLGYSSTGRGSSGRSLWSGGRGV